MSSILRPPLETEPAEYVPYDGLLFCSNQLNHVKFPIQVGDYKPLLVGRGDRRPQLWIAAPTDASRQVWSWVVEKNIPRHPKFKVNRSGRGFVVLAGNVSVIEVTEKSPGQAEVSYLDLKPIGLLVEGDRNGLRVGNSSFTSTMVSNSHVFISS